MSYNIFDVIRDELLNSAEYVDKNTYDKRVQLCITCKHYSITHQCMECGCFVAVKAKYKPSECPIGKWNAVPLEV